jgi:uncharacterized glyoxalase superfamily protein PhnB
MRTGPHLHFKSNCRAAFESYVETFGGRIDRIGIPWMVNCETPLDSIARAPAAA